MGSKETFDVAISLGEGGLHENDGWRPVIDYDGKRFCLSQEPGKVSVYSILHEDHRPHGKEQYKMKDRSYLRKCEHNPRIDRRIIIGYIKSSVIETLISKLK